MIDIGPYKIDLYRYLKTELYDNWFLRSISAPDCNDRYFCYASNSKYKPQERHFQHLSKDITPEAIAHCIKKIIGRLESFKELTFF